MDDRVRRHAEVLVDHCTDVSSDDREFNESARHVDVLVDMSEDSFIEVDGEIVQRNGTFRFEDGFED